MKAILYKDGLEIKRGKYPRMDMDFIEGLEDGLEWKLIIEAEKPPITNLEKLEPIETVTNDPHDIHTHLKVVNVTWNVVRKSDEEIIQLIKQAKTIANSGVFGAEHTEEIMLLALGALIKLARAETIPGKADVLLDKILNKAVKVWQNDTVIKNKLEQLANSEDVNINTDWTNE